MIGQDLVKGISTEQRKFLFARAKAAVANQLVVKKEGSNLIFVLLLDGRQVDTFAFVDEEEQAKKNESDKIPGVGGKLTSQQETELRDTIIDAARSIGLEGDALDRFIEKKVAGRLTPEQTEQLKDLIKAQRLDDLIDYIHINLTKRVHDEKTTNKIRIVTPRGFLRKSFANIDEPTMKIILDRLGARGWSEAQLQEFLVASLPAKLKKRFHIESKELTPEK